MKLGSPKGIRRAGLSDKFFDLEEDEKMEEPHLSTWLQALKIQKLTDRAEKRRTPCVTSESA